MPVSDWSDLCPQTIVWEPMTGRDQYGKPVYGGTPQTFRGRRVHKRSRIAASIGATAIDVLAESEIWILGLPDVKNDDRVYVQGDTEFPPILLISRFPDEDGDLFVKVFFGSFGGAGTIKPTG